MKLLYALLSDYAFLSIDKKVNIIGVFETINAQKFPVVHPRFVIVGSIKPSKKDFSLKVNIVSSEGSSILRDFQEKEVNLPAGSDQNFNFIIEVINIEFSKPGDYKVEIVIDGEVIGYIPLKVLEAKFSSLGTPS